jgi:tetratricopeptide (TPR) repeat protein
MTGYGTREVAQILGLSPARVRGYVRAGLLAPGRGPRGEYRFSFPDLVFLRTARGLLEARIPERRIRRALRVLAREAVEPGRLPDVRIAAEGSRVVAGDGKSRWHPESGQTLLEFGREGREAPVEPLSRETPTPARRDGLSAEDWYERALDLETREPARAQEAYEAALRQDPSHGPARVNLGRLLHERGDAAAAEAHYRAALAGKPEDATAAFNLGVALEDLGRDREALSAYESALQLDPSDADAHFNAANLCERLRDTAAALRHWMSYRNLTRPAD